MKKVILNLQTLLFGFLALSCMSANAVGGGGIGISLGEEVISERVLFQKMVTSISVASVGGSTTGSLNFDGHRNFRVLVNYPLLLVGQPIKSELVETVWLDQMRWKLYDGKGQLTVTPKDIGSLSPLLKWIGQFSNSTADILVKVEYVEQIVRLEDKFNSDLPGLCQKVTTVVNSLPIPDSDLDLVRSKVKVRNVELAECQKEKN